MRKIESDGNAASSESFSSRADSRSWPNGFSMTTRRQVSPAVESSETRPDFSSCWATTSNAFGGIDR